MVVFVCLHIALPHYDHYADVSVGIELNACQVHSVECVSRIKSILAIIFHEIYGAVYMKQWYAQYAFLRS